MRGPVRGQVAASIAANRFGLGARPGELRTVTADPRGWLAAQLKAPPPVLTGDGLVPCAQTLARGIEIRRGQATLRRALKASGAGPAEPTVAAGAAAAAATTPTATVSSSLSSGTSSARAASPAPDSGGMQKLPAFYRPIYLDEAFARVAHAATTDRPFLERLTAFWTNHFAVSVDKIAVLGLAGAFEREAIRPHTTGDFVDMLLAVERHPAMLMYLDNFASIGPRSPAGERGARRAERRAAEGREAPRVGINENLAREILELHTLGVDGGYTQADVTTFAQAISGWSIAGEEGDHRFPRLIPTAGAPANGEFVFREAFHEPGPKTLLGRTYADAGQAQGEAILRDVAARPQTARHVCTKLARHFIADQPPRSAVQRMTKAWLDSRGHLPAVYAALIASPEAWQTPLAKFKTPADYVTSVYRALGVPMREKRRAVHPYELLGQRIYTPGSPAGWPDSSADWDGSAALMRRIAWTDALAQRLGDTVNARDLGPDVLGATLSSETATAVARAETGAQGLTLLLAAPEFMRR